MIAEPSTRVVIAGDEAIAEAARYLAAGGLVAFPTETVYGLGADATDGKAIARLYAAKGRPSFNPLIAHVAGLDAARRLAVFNPMAELLAQAFWPGPLTLVLPKQPNSGVSDLATAGLDTIGLRWPNHGVAHDLLRTFGKPIVAPSANRSGHVSPTTAAHVKADLNGRIDLILDGGQTSVGIESTIVACSGEPILLRLGGIARDEIETMLRQRVRVSIEAAPGDIDIPLAPGMLASHYAPASKLRLNAKDVRAGEALLAFGPGRPAGGEHALRALNLSPTGDLVEAAANLFSHLRALDALNATTIAVMPIPGAGLGEAINDRLSRAAAPRGD